MGKTVESSDGRGWISSEEELEAVRARDMGTEPSGIEPEIKTTIYQKVRFVKA